MLAQRESTEAKVLALLATDPGSILHTMLIPLSIPGVILEQRTKSEPWTLMGVVPKQTHREKKPNITSV